MPSFTSLLLLQDNAQSVLLSLGSQTGQRAAYDPFGYHFEAVARVAFNGQVREAISECYLLGHGHRAYSPSLRRFLRPDALSPFGAGGLNGYVYCKGDPVNNQDPMGTTSIGTVLVGALFIASGVYLVTRDEPISKVAGYLVIAVGGFAALTGLFLGSGRGGIDSIKFRYRPSSQSSQGARNRMNSRSSVSSSSSSSSSAIPRSSRAPSRGNLPAGDSPIARRLPAYPRAMGIEPRTIISAAQPPPISQRPLVRKPPLHGSNWTLRSSPTNSVT
jgi:RHS repeat-associated protein